MGTMTDEAVVNKAMAIHRQVMSYQHQQTSWLSISAAARLVGLPVEAIRLLVADGAFLAQIKHYYDKSNSGARVLYMDRQEFIDVYERLKDLEAGSPNIEK